MRRILLSMTALVLVAAIGGCLISGTKVFEYDVIQKANFGNPITLQGSDSETIAIDLSDNSVFEEHKDEIKTIDRVGFTATVHTNNSTTANFTISFRPKDGAWMTLISGLSVSGLSNPVMPVEISYKQSEAVITNFAAFQTAAESGSFDLRCETGTAGYDIDITALTLVITFTVGL